MRGAGGRKSCSSRGNKALKLHHSQMTNAVEDILVTRFRLQLDSRLHGGDNEGAAEL